MTLLEFPFLPQSDTSFFKDALCPQTDPEAFFPDKGSPGKEAKEICYRCEVATRCLQWAIENEMEYGIWGGLSARERKNLTAGRVVDARQLERLGLQPSARRNNSERIAG